MSIITVTEYKTLVNQTGSDPSDTEIQLALDRYTALIESYTGRTFALQEYVEKYYPSGNEPVALNHRPVNAITEIAIGAETSDGSDLKVHRGAGLIYQEGLWDQQTVQITYSAGYSAAPADLQQAIATLVQGYLSGIAGGVNTLGLRKETVAGVGSVDYGNPAQDQAAYGDPFVDLGPYITLLDRYVEPVYL